jgi:hypothetical protein
VKDRLSVLNEVKYNSTILLENYIPISIVYSSKGKNRYIQVAVRIITRKRIF